MTKAEILALIADNIADENTAGSISPADVSDCLNAIVEACFIDETFIDLDDAATIDINMSAGRNFKIIPSIAGDRDITVSNVVEGREIKLRVPQDATGNRTLTFPAGTKIPHGFHTGTTMNLTTAGNAVDYISIFHDGESLVAIPVFNLD